MGDGWFDRLTTNELGMRWMDGMAVGIVGWLCAGIFDSSLRSE